MDSYSLMFCVVRSFLVREACISVLVHGKGFIPLEYNGVPSNEICNGSMR